jgi:hypothetical protein
MKHRIIISFLFISFFIISCSAIKPSLSEVYQPLGTAVLTANGLLMVEYPEIKPEYINQNDYKNLLKEDYDILYQRLLPFEVQIKKSENNYIIKVFECNLLILTDWLCTENKIDCWSYNQECNPDTLIVNCR